VDAVAVRRRRWTSAIMAHQQMLLRMRRTAKYELLFSTSISICNFMIESERELGVLVIYVNINVITER